MGLLFDRASNFTYTINSSVDSVVGAAKGLICLGSNILGALSNPKALAKNLGALAGGIAAAVATSVVGLINNRVNSLIYSALSPVRQIEGILLDVTNTLVNIRQTFQNISSTVNDFERFLSKRQECASSGATFMNCIASAVTKAITSKIAMNIDKEFSKVHSSVVNDVMKTNGVLYNNVDRNTEFLNKAQQQIRFLT